MANLLIFHPDCKKDIRLVEASIEVEEVLILHKAYDLRFQTHSGAVSGQFSDKSLSV